MNMLHIGAISFCALATLAGSIALKRDTAGDVMDQAAPTGPAAAAALAWTTDIATINNRRRTTPAGASHTSEFLPESDTTGLLQESLTIDDLLNEIDADAGIGSSAVDRERFAAVLRSDPELRRAIVD